MESTIKVEKPENKKNKELDHRVHKQVGNGYNDRVPDSAIWSAHADNIPYDEQHDYNTQRNIDSYGNSNRSYNIPYSKRIRPFSWIYGYLATSLVMTMFVWYSMSTFTSIGLALLVALVVAAVNSFLIVKLRVPDMLATLASMFIFQGVAMTYSGGGSVSQNMARLDGTITTGKVPELFSKIGQAPWIILIMLVIVLIVHIFLTYTKHGRYICMQ